MGIFNNKNNNSQNNGFKPLPSNNINLNRDEESYSSHANSQQNQNNSHDQIDDYVSPTAQAFNDLQMRSGVSEFSLPSSEDLIDSMLREDEETAELERRLREGDLQENAYANHSIERIMENNMARLRREHPMGGIKASRFITTDVLLAAPQDYFSRFDDEVSELVSYVQATIADRGESTDIANAEANPTDDNLQNIAYRKVYTLAIGYMEKKKHHRPLERAIIIALACNEIVGFSRLDPLWRDHTIDEIICNGPYDVQIEIDGKLLRVPSCRFIDADHLIKIINRLYTAIGKKLARTSPMPKGRLHDNSRLFSTDVSVSPSGPNFNIRRHKEDYIGPERLLDWGTASEELMTELGNWIYKGCSYIVSGSTSSGKTTALGALCTFIRPDARVITLEDNIELKLPSNKLLAAPMECIPARPDMPGDTGVNMRDLVKGSLQMRPDGIIIGEVTDGSAYDLTQALNTGHWGASTIHANNEFDAIYRLTSLVTQGASTGNSMGMSSNSALPLIAAAFNFIVQVQHYPEDGSRKIVSISEVAPFPERNEHQELVLPTKIIWEFVRHGLENGRVVGEWVKRNEISETTKKRLRLDLEDYFTWNELVKKCGAEHLMEDEDESVSAPHHLQNDQENNITHDQNQDNVIHTNVDNVNQADHSESSNDESVFHDDVTSTNDDYVEKINEELNDINAADDNEVEEESIEPDMIQYVISGDDESTEEDLKESVEDNENHISNEHNHIVE